MTQAGDGKAGAGRGSAGVRRRWLPWLWLALAAGAWLALQSGQKEWLSLDALARHHGWLSRWVAAHFWLAGAAYVAAYAAVVAVSLPGGTVMTLAGGLLFGWLAGGAFAAIGATIGATLVFLLARGPLGAWLARRNSATLARMRAGFQRDAWNWMLMLRLVPLFPFVLVNLAPALFGVPLRIYVAATLIGILPATFVYALAGAGLGRVFAEGREIGLAGLMPPELMIALAGLGLLALLPALWRRRQENTE